MKFLRFVLLILLSSCHLINGEDPRSGRPTILSNASVEVPPEEEEEEVPVVIRPDGAVFIQNDYCGCQNRQMIMLGNCVNFCQQKNVAAATLYANVKLGPEIELEADLVDLNGWCNTPFGENSKNPQCLLEVTDGQNTFALPVVVPPGINSFSADISSLELDTTFLATLVETTSGSRSDTIQFRKIEEVDIEPSLGPLKITGITKYACVQRDGPVDTSGSGQDIYELAIKRHFYYPTKNNPPTLPPKDDASMFCHDITTYGVNDSPLFPRLESEDNFFLIWDESDIRFFATNNAEQLDVNFLIQTRLAEEYNVSSQINIFQEVRLQNYPLETTGGTPRAGFIMTPWLEKSTGEVYCPNQSHLDSDVPVFKILKEYIPETEAVYLAVKEPEVFFDNSGNVIEAPPDFLLIRENLVNKIWFYLQGGLHVKPDDITKTKKTLHFYWPPDENFPLIKKSNQASYTIKSPEEATGAPQFGLRSSVSPPDKRIFCIPKL